MGQLATVDGDVLWTYFLISFANNCQTSRTACSMLGWKLPNILRESGMLLINSILSVSNCDHQFSVYVFIRFVCSLFDINIKKP